MDLVKIRLWVKKNLGIELVEVFEEKGDDE